MDVQLLMSEEEEYCEGVRDQVMRLVRLHPGGAGLHPCAPHSDFAPARTSAQAIEAEQGLVESMFDLAVVLCEGDESVRDEEAAVHWFQAAADQGCACCRRPRARRPDRIARSMTKAMYALAVCYDEGVGGVPSRF